MSLKLGQESYPAFNLPSHYNLHNASRQHLVLDPSCLVSFKLKRYNLRCLSQLPKCDEMVGYISVCMVLIRTCLHCCLVQTNQGCFHYKLHTWPLPKGFHWHLSPLEKKKQQIFSHSFIKYTVIYMLLPNRVKFSDGNQEPSWTPLGLLIPFINADIFFWQWQNSYVVSTLLENSNKKESVLQCW